MISVELARKLRDAGLEWVPAEGDRFMIPDRDLEEYVFSISEMTIEVQQIAGRERIMFNGAVEWALDSIVQREVIWLPSEAQLRDRLGKAFRALHRTASGYRCELLIDNAERTFDATEPADTYALALLDLLSDPGTMLRLMVEDE